MLEQAATPFEQWVVLNRTATGELASADLLAGRLRIPVPAAADALAALRDRGLLDPDGALTPAGRARHAEISAGLAGITARLYGDLPADDLAVAGRVLTLVTARAQAELGHPRLAATPVDDASGVGRGWATMTPGRRCR